MELVSILLTFIRALGCGDWNLYKSTFKRMMVCCLLSHPFTLHKMSCCIHSRHGFLDGDFRAKETRHCFSEVSFDLRLKRKLERLLEGCWKADRHHS